MEGQDLGGQLGGDLWCGPFSTFPCSGQALGAPRAHRTGHRPTESRVRSSRNCLITAQVGLILAKTTTSMRTINASRWWPSGSFETWRKITAKIMVTIWRAITSWRRPKPKASRHEWGVTLTPPPPPPSRRPAAPSAPSPCPAAAGRGRGSPPGCSSPPAPG